MPKGAHVKYTQEQLDFIKSNCFLERKELAKQTNIHFGTSLTVDQIKALCTRQKWKSGRTGRFEKGSKSWNSGTKGICKTNSGTFKLGIRAWNKKSIGYERITQDGYIEIKIAEPNVFDLKHRIIWEQYNGSIPKDCALAFKNMDKTDCRIENLILLTRAELCRLNQSFIQYSTPETHESCILLAKIKNATHQSKAEIVR